MTENIRDLFDANATPEQKAKIDAVMKILLDQNGAKPTNTDARTLQKAIEAGDTAAVGAIVDKFGTSVNTQDTLTGYTNIMWAAMHGQKDMVSFLITKGFSVNELSAATRKSKGGSTALIVAAGRGFHDIAEILIKNGADVNVATADGQTAFSVIKSGDRKMARLLADNGVTLNAVIAKGDAEMADVILSKSAEAVNTKDCCGKTPLVKAIELGNEASVVVLLKHNATLDKAEADALRANRPALVALAESAVREKELREQIKELTKRCETPGPELPPSFVPEGPNL